MKQKIGVFDSGMGGITILAKLREILPHEDYIYYSDSKNNPYGEKSDEELLNLTSRIIDELSYDGCALVIIACNTASTVVSSLRNKYTIPIVATEPALKEAFDKGEGNILVMATKHTLESSKFETLLKSFNQDTRKVYLDKAVGLAPLIEQEQEKEIDIYLQENLSPYLDKNIKSVVLGCTHYPIIKDKIQNFFKEATIFDSSNGVAKRVATLINESKTGGSLKIKSSKLEDIDKTKRMLDKLERRM